VCDPNASDLSRSSSLNAPSADDLQHRGPAGKCADSQTRPVDLPELHIGGTPPLERVIELFAESLEEWAELLLGEL
jgi:hypothetical protein